MHDAADQRRDPSDVDEVSSAKDHHAGKRARPQLAGKTAFARLVPERLAPGERTEDPAQRDKADQRAAEDVNS